MCSVFILHALIAHYICPYENACLPFGGPRIKTVNSKFWYLDLCHSIYSIYGQRRGCEFGPHLKDWCLEINLSTFSFQRRILQNKKYIFRKDKWMDFSVCGKRALVKLHYTLQLVFLLTYIINIICLVTHQWWLLKMVKSLTGHRDWPCDLVTVVTGQWLYYFFFTM